MYAVYRWVTCLRISFNPQIGTVHRVHFALHVSVREAGGDQWHQPHRGDG